MNREHPVRAEDDMGRIPSPEDSVERRRGQGL